MAEYPSKTLAFLYERGRDPTRAFSRDEALLLQRTHLAFDNAAALVLRLGGKSGRLGECIVATALLEGLLQELSHAGKAGTPVTIIVDDAAGELFNSLNYQDAYWPAIQTLTAPTGELLEAEDWRRYALPSAPALFVDLHGAHDGIPYLQEIGSDLALMHLYRAGIRYYARHGPLRRYCDYVEDLLASELVAIDPRLAQPKIRLGKLDQARYTALAQEVDWQEEAFHVVGFFQSVVVAKCYERWDEVLEELATLVARRWPDKPIQLLVACGPADQQPRGFQKEDLAATFAGFTGTLRNTRVRVEQIPSLSDLAVLLSRASLVLSNDTGPGHLAGALSVPTITPFLPGGVYSKEVWASSLWHRGITLEPNPFTTGRIESAVIWGDSSIINLVEPSRLAAEAFEALVGQSSEHQL
ncbi:MAG: glycosyltransferase family 9 protein [Ktedonobacterales bacterium]